MFDCILEGPWFIGEVLEDHYGVVFAWGTFVHGKVLPGSFTYFYGFFQVRYFYWLTMGWWIRNSSVLLLFVSASGVSRAICFAPKPLCGLQVNSGTSASYSEVPPDGSLLSYLGYPFWMNNCGRISYRFKSQCWEGSPCCYTGILFQHLPCLTYIVIQALFAYSFWLAYGTMAFIVGPLRTWSVFMAFMLWITAATLRSSDFESVSAMFIKGPSNGDKYSPATIAVTNSNNSDDNGTVRVNNPQEQL